MKNKIKLFREEFSVAGINYCILSNFDIKNLLLDPQPYNLHINYLIRTKTPSKDFFTISILKNTKKLDIRTSDKKLRISGDINPMFSNGYNPQFGLFGNKGIIHRFILHTLERSTSISAIHAAAIIHPTKHKICIAVGASGSGKSVFTSNALKIGWKLIATEQVLVGINGEIFRGNHHDNTSPKAVNFIENELKDAVIFKEKMLVEPVGSKVFIDLSKYSTDQESLNLKHGNFTLVVLNFGNGQHKSGSKIIDEDFLLRILQQTASEKICSPAIFNNQIFDLNLNGSPENRTTIVNSLIAKSKNKVVLGGDYLDFEKWLKNEYEN